MNELEKSFSLLTEKYVEKCSEARSNSKKFMVLKRKINTLFKKVDDTMFDLENGSRKPDDFIKVIYGIKNTIKTTIEEVEHEAV